MEIVPQFIPDLFYSEVVKPTSDYFAGLPVGNFPVAFDFGHYPDVINNLIEKDQSPVMATKKSKFPLIWLVTDFIEKMGQGNDNYYTQASPLTIIIAMDTEIDYSGEQRRDKTFLPILYPIYAKMMFYISESSAFGMPHITTIKHNKINRPYWGKNGEANFLAHIVDCIEINNLSLNVNRIC